jgi:hypothetical protein
MIDYNKNVTPLSPKFSVDRTVRKVGHSRAKTKKLTADNKRFLKLIGLLR